MQLFYFQNIKEGSNNLEKDEARHIAKVLRKKNGDLLQITDGLGTLFDCEITFLAGSKCTVEAKLSKREDELDPSLTMAVCPTKSTDRYEWFLEKATELGINSIVPIISKHSERKTVKIDRWNKILISAMKQCKRLFIPDLADATSFEEFIQTHKNDQKFIAYCSDESLPLLLNVTKQNANTTILIGPEGDFNQDEIQLAIDNGWKGVSFGSARLRTETAAIYAVTTFRNLQF